MWSSLEMRRMHLNPCQSLPPMTIFCTWWRTFSLSPSPVGSSMKLDQHKAINPLNLDTRCLHCYGLGHIIFSLNRLWLGPHCPQPHPQWHLHCGWGLWLIHVVCFLFQQRRRNLPQTSYVELVLVADNLRVGVQDPSMRRLLWKHEWFPCNRSGVGVIAYAAMWLITYFSNS